MTLATSGLGPVMVHTSKGRGFSVEEVTDRCLDRLMKVSDSAPPAIKEQALAYRESMRAVIRFYMMEAIKSDRTSVYNILKNNGHGDIAPLILKEL